jgi:hypothetical protein
VIVYEHDLSPLLATALSEVGRILPAILSASRFSLIQSWARFQAVISPDRPLADMQQAEQELVFSKICKTITAQPCTLWA